MPTTATAALEREAERIYLRYATEFIEGLGLCPWAAPAREAGRVAVRVIVGSDPTPARALPTLAALSSDASVDIALLIFPELTLDRLDFARFTATLREADTERMGRGHTVFALADFHPNAHADLNPDSPERLIPFIRSSPDPTIQCVRRSALDEVRMGDSQGTKFVDSEALANATLAELSAGVEPLNRRVARANLRTVQREGIDALQAMLDGILADRDRSYAALGIAPPPWSARAQGSPRSPDSPGTPDDGDTV